MQKIFHIKKSALILFAVCVLLASYILNILSERKDRLTNIVGGTTEITSMTKDVYEGCRLKQEFQIPANARMEFISIQFATYSNAIEDDGIRFTVQDDNGNKLWEEDIPGSNLSDNAFYTISFGDGIYSETGKYFFTIEGKTPKQAGLAPAVWCSLNNDVAGNLYVDGKLQKGSLSASYKYSWRDSGLFVQVIVQLFLCMLLTFLSFQIFKHRGFWIVIQLLLYLANLYFIEWWTESIGMQDVVMTADIRRMTVVFIFCVQTVLFGLCQNVYWTVFLTDSVLAVATLANYFVMVYRGVTIVPSDLFSLGTLTTVVGNYKLTFTSRQMVMLGWLIVLFWFNWKLMISDKLHQKWEKNRNILAKKLSMGAVCLTIGLSGLCVLSNPEVLEQVGISSYIWDRNQGYYCNGPFMNFMVNVQYTKIKPPKGYSKMQAISYLKEYEEKESSVDLEPVLDQKPNIIMIMNESFADYETYHSEGSVKFSQDPLPFIHSMTNHTVVGSCYVSVFGARTSNSELEALTGHSMAFFPSGSVVYQQFPKKKTYGMVSSLNRQGYKSIAIHPCTRTNWNRHIVYDSMGFDEFYTQEQFEGAEEVRWISDKATYDKIIELYEEKDKNEPLFIFDVTMQGHGGYNSGYRFETTISAQDRNYPYLSEYLSSLYVSDQAFEYLINYFSTVDEPVMIVMFGDHQPSVEDDFYEELLGKPITGLSLEESQKRYVTPYVLWTNYGVKKLTKSENDISANRFCDKIKSYAGLEKNSYEKFIHAFSEVIPLINANGYMDYKGDWYGYEEESPYLSMLHSYHVIQYAIYCDGLDPEE